MGVTDVRREDGCGVRRREHGYDGKKGTYYMVQY